MRKKNKIQHGTLQCGRDLSSQHGLGEVEGTWEESKEKQ